MTTEVQRIIDQLERGYNGDAWHGTPLRALIGDIDAARAARHPAAGAHSIWELVEHITFWLNGVRRRLDGELVEADDASDWRVEDDPTDARWHEVLAALDVAHERLLEAVRRLSDVDLEREVPTKGYTSYVMLHGVLQHSLYHAGQIALLLSMSAAR